MKKMYYLGYLALSLIAFCSCESIFDDENNIDDENENDIEATIIQVAQDFLVEGQKGYYILSDSTGKVVTEGILENGRSYDLVVDTIGGDIHFTYLICTPPSYIYTYSNLDDLDADFTTFAFFPKSGGVYYLDHYNNTSIAAVQKHQRNYDNFAKTTLNLKRTRELYGAFGVSLSGGTYSYIGVGTGFNPVLSSSTVPERFLFYARYNPLENIQADDIVFSEVTLKKGDITFLDLDKRDNHSFKPVRVELGSDLYFGRHSDPQRFGHFTNISIYNPSLENMFSTQSGHLIHTSEGALYDIFDIRRRQNYLPIGYSRYGRDIWYPKNWLEEFKNDRYKITCKSDNSWRNGGNWRQEYIGYLPVKQSIKFDLPIDNIPLKAQKTWVINNNLFIVETFAILLEESTVNDGLIRVHLRDDEFIHFVGEAGYEWDVILVPNIGRQIIKLPILSASLYDYMEGLSRDQINQLHIIKTEYKYSDVKKYSHEQEIRDFFVDYDTYINRKVIEGNYWTISLSQ